MTIEILDLKENFINYKTPSSSDLDDLLITNKLFY